MQEEQKAQEQQEQRELESEVEQEHYQDAMHAKLQQVHHCRVCLAQL